MSHTELRSKKILVFAGEQGRQRKNTTFDCKLVSALMLELVDIQVLYRFLPT